MLRRVLLLLVGLAVLMTLAACAGGQPEETQPQAASASSPDNQLTGADPEHEDAESQSDRQADSEYTLTTGDST